MTTTKNKEIVILVTGATGTVGSEAGLAVNDSMKFRVVY
jgi:FlaA1/EpsC-like NDP-sugar epimerase